MDETPWQRQLRLAIEEKQSEYLTTWDDPGRRIQLRVEIQLLTREYDRKLADMTVC